MKPLLAVLGLVMVFGVSPITAQVSGYPVQVNEYVMEGLLIHKVPPKFPQDLGPSVQGPVILRATIDKEGNVARLQVVTGHPLLVAAAIDAVKQWKYRPYLLHGEAVEVTTMIGVGYSRIGKDAPEQIASESQDQTVTGTKIQVHEGAAPTLLLRKVAPVYPPLARAARIQGNVVIGIVVNKEGEVRDTNLVSGHPMLARAAIDAVKQWRYKPYMANDQPVEVATTVQVNFKIAGGPDGDTPRGTRADWHLSLPGPQFVRLSEDVMQDFLDGRVDPEYPSEAKAQHIEGTVVLNVDVDDDGSVGRVELVRGHELLAAAAMDAVLQWRYRPFVLNGAPIAVETTVQLKFELAK